MCGSSDIPGPGSSPSSSMGFGVSSNRGYDSAGIALVTHAGELFVEKRAGKVAVLQGRPRGEPPTAGVGLGHTRWPPTDASATSTPIPQ